MTTIIQPLCGLKKKTPLVAGKMAIPVKPEKRQPPCCQKERQPPWGRQAVTLPTWERVAKDKLFFNMVESNWLKYCNYCTIHIVVYYIH